MDGRSQLEIVPRIHKQASRKHAATRYEHEYANHQLTVLSSEANKLFQFTNLSMISFR